MRLLKTVIGMGVAIVMIQTILVLFVFRSKRTENPPLVNTSVGVIRGLWAEDGSAMFLGIPYSIVDENNPFGAPLRNPVFEDVFDAVSDSVKCPQLDDLQLEVPDASLNCLHLNIHVPDTTEKFPLPVIVYFYGGKFMSGLSDRKTYGPKFVIRHNVIYVSFNYRTSAYGFMCLHTPEVPGNQGLKDQTNALRWIKANIRSFGGDDENITIIGSSSGGACVDLQLLFADEGLFHKVISLSGTSLDPWVFIEPDLNAAIKIASQLSFISNSTREAITFLSNCTPSQILSAVNTLKMSFNPCIEKEMPNVDRFITSHPVRAPLAKAAYVPILYGYTDDETLLCAPSESLNLINESIKMEFNFGANHDTMVSFVRQFYTGDEPMSPKLKQSIIDFSSDFRFAHPAQRMLMKYVDHGGEAYHYVFSYVGGRNTEKIRFNVIQGGAVHADDLGYLFDMPNFKNKPYSDDQLIIDRFTTIFTNFAKYGNPTPSLTELLPVQWLPVTKNRLNYLNITKTLELRTRPLHQRLSFWDFFYHINKKYVRGYSEET